MRWPLFAKVTTIGALYTAQTFAVGFVTQLLPAIYRAQQLPLERYWVFSICLLPFALRFLWAPVVDRVGSLSFGKRRSWILPCTVTAAIVYLLIALVEPTIDRLALMIGLVFVVCCVLATQEIAVDGYFVENLQPAERGLGSATRGYMEAVAELGSLAGLALVYQHFGWSSAVATAALLLILFTLPGLLRRETPIAPTAGRTAAPASLLEFLRRGDTWAMAPILIFGGLSQGMYFTMLGAFLVDKGFTVQSTGLILGICVVIGWLIAGPVATKIADRAGLRLAILGLTVAFVPLFVSAIVLASVPQQAQWLTMAGLALPTFALAQLTILYYIARLNWASQAQAATDYTSQGALLRVGQISAPALGGALAAALGWRGFFIFYALFGAATSLLFLVLEPRVSALAARRSPVY